MQLAHGSRWISSQGILEAFLDDFFLKAIRRVRNRYPHGSHAITLKMVNDLNNLRHILSSAVFLGDQFHLTVMEAMLLSACSELNRGNDFKVKLNGLVPRHATVLAKYPGKASGYEKKHYEKSV